MTGSAKVGDLAEEVVPEGGGEADRGEQRSELLVVSQKASSLVPVVGGLRRGGCGSATSTEVPASSSWTPPCCASGPGHAAPLQPLAERLLRRLRIRGRIGSGGRAQPVASERVSDSVSEPTSCRRGVRRRPRSPYSRAAKASVPAGGRVVLARVDDAVGGGVGHGHRTERQLRLTLKSRVAPAASVMHASVAATATGPLIVAVSVLASTVPSAVQIAPVAAGAAASERLRDIVPADGLGVDLAQVVAPVHAPRPAHRAAGDREGLVAQHPVARPWRSSAHQLLFRAGSAVSDAMDFALDLWRHPHACGIVAPMRAAGIKSAGWHLDSAPALCRRRRAPGDDSFVKRLVVDFQPRPKNEVARREPEVKTDRTRMNPQARGVGTLGGRRP